MADTPAPPRPLVTEAAKPFWTGLQGNHVVIQRCGNCHSWVWYPRERCTTCLSDDLRWTEVSGRATVYTYTVARSPTMPAFADDTPQLLAIVELDEGVRVTTTLADVAPEDVRIGMAVAPVFDHGSDGITLLRYRPA